MEYKYGDVVELSEGYQQGSRGVVYKTPNDENQNHYVVITEDHPYGEWISETGMTLVTESSDEIRSKVFSAKAMNHEYDGYIPEDVNPYDFILEMAEVYPKYNEKYNIKNGFKVSVEPKEGPVPHVHVIYKDGRIAYVKLCSANYLDKHEKKTKYLNHDEKVALYNFFTTKMTLANNEIKTCWEAAVDLWVLSIAGDDYKREVFERVMQRDLKTGKYVMPNYLELE